MAKRSSSNPPKVFDKPRHDSPDPLEAFTKTERKCLEDGQLPADKIIELRKRRQGSPSPENWREISKFFHSPLWLEQKTKQKELVTAFTGIRRSYQRLYRPLLNIPPDTFDELAALRNDGTGPQRKGPTIDRVSMPMFLTVGRLWPKLQTKHEGAELKDHVLKVVRGAVNREFEVENLPAILLGNPRSDEEKAATIRRRLAALATALAKIAPAKQRRELLGAATIYRRRKVAGATKKVSKAQREKLIVNVLEIATSLDD